MTATSHEGISLLCEGAPRVRLKFPEAGGEEGLPPWIDEKSLRGGDDWAHEIEKAIEETHYLVFFLSANSVGREGVMRLEVNLALRHVDKKQIGARLFVPARLEPCSINPSIGRFHYVDVFGKNGLTDLVGVLSPSG